MLVYVRWRSRYDDNTCPPRESFVNVPADYFDWPEHKARDLLIVELMPDTARTMIVTPAEAGVSGTHVIGPDLTRR